LRQWDRTLLTSNNTKTQHRDKEEKSEKYKPHCFYTEAVDFKDEYDYPFTQTLSFTATSNAEVKYEATKTDPEIAVIGVDEHFMTNSGLETNLGRNFTGFDIDNNNYVCVVGSD
jgi:putative ABC transport system permease protein